MLCLAALVLAAAAGPGSDDTAEELAAARKHLLHGEYEEAVAGYEALADHPQAGVPAALGMSQCRQATGQMSEASAVVERSLAQHPDRPELVARLAELALERGELDRAGELAARAIELNPEELVARWVAAEHADATGQSDAAARGYEWFISYFNGHNVAEPDALVLVGRGAAEHAQRTLQGREQSQQLSFVLNDLLDAAGKQDPDLWVAPYASGLLFLSKFQKGDALKDLRRALAINPSAAPIHVALGQAALQDYDIDAGLEHCDRALAIDPAAPAAHRLRADLLMVLERFPEALAELERAAEANPISEETLARSAACHLFAHQDAEFERITAEVAARSPRPVTFWWRLGERLEDQRRFDRAEACLRRAVELGPDRAGPATALGLLFMRIGKEEEAARILDDAFQKDPFNVRTKNMLEVLDQLKGYATLETEHFRLRVDPKLDNLLGRYAARYLEEVYAELTRQFAFEPETPIQIEIFNKGRGQSAHQWFSARTVGLPWIGTVGACTGKVVAMASPAGVDKPYNWARVLKHEVSHVITLQQTHFNIPHWYTEALAVRCEGYPRPQLWNQLLLERVPSGDLFNLDNINLAFARPKTQLDWQMAYCESELYAEYMESRFGPDAPARLLAAYRDGLATTEAIERVFETPRAEFEQGYRDFLEKLVGTLHAGPSEPKRTFAELERAYLADPSDPNAAAALAHEHLRRREYPKARELALKATAAQPNHPLGSFVLARLSMLVGDLDRARAILADALDRDKPDRRVLELLGDLETRAKQFPEAAARYELGRRMFPGDSVWVSGLARIALLRGDRDELRTALDELRQLEPDDPSPRKKLASMAIEDEDWAAAAGYAWMALHIDVADADSHTLLGDAYAGQERWGDAADAYQTVRELKPGQKGLLLKLAHAQRSADRREQAIATARELLEREPENGEARQLLGELDSKD